MSLASYLPVLVSVTLENLISGGKSKSDRPHKPDKPLSRKGNALVIYPLLVIALTSTTRVNFAGPCLVLNHFGFGTQLQGNRIRQRQSLFSLSLSL